MVSALTLCAGLHAAGIEDHFKPALNKPDTAPLRGVDCLYVINLDERPEKFEKTQNQLVVWGIEPYRFSAVNGWQLSPEVLNSLGVSYEPWMKKGLWGTSYLAENEGQPSHEVMHVVGKNYFCHCMSRGAIGITLSHMSVLQDAYDSGYQRIWVMEDDIAIPAGKNPHEVSDLIDQLDELLGEDGWDILFTDPDTKDQKGNYVTCYGYAYRPNIEPDDAGKFARRVHLNDKFTQVGARYGAYSMIVNRCGMEKILNFIKSNKVFLPFDMEYTWPTGIRLICTREDVVSTIPNALSDNGAPGYMENKN